MFIKHFITALTIFLGCYISATAQKLSYSKGAYASLKDLLENKPSLDESNYNIEKVFPIKKNEEIGVYKIASNNDNYKNTYFRKNIFAVTKSNELFINSKFLDITPQFCKVVNTGKYITFLVAIKDDEAQMIGAMLFGLVGALATAGTVEMKLYAYSLDTESGISELLNPKRMNELLSPFPDLKESYNNDTNNAWKTVMIDYIEKLNKKFEKE